MDREKEILFEIFFLNATPEEEKMMQKVVYEEIKKMIKKREERGSSPLKVLVGKRDGKGRSKLEKSARILAITSLIISVTTLLILIWL